MHFFSTLLFVLAAATVNGLPSIITIPPTDENGIYFAEDDGNGNLKRTKLANSTTLGVDDFELQKRGTLVNPTTVCSTTSETINNRKSLRYAKFTLQKFCNDGQKIPAWISGKSGVLYSKQDGAIWYGCSWGGVNPCSPGEILEAEALMNQKCEAYKSAWVEMQDWKKGYGRAVDGKAKCSQDMN